METEIHGLIFADGDNGTYNVFDLNYMCSVGTISLADGPGWIIDVDASFLDYGQLMVLAEFIKKLNHQIKDKKP